MEDRVLLLLRSGCWRESLLSGSLSSSPASMLWGGAIASEANWLEFPFIVYTVKIAEAAVEA